jgi:hypothetical protein
MSVCAAQAFPTNNGVAHLKPVADASRNRRDGRRGKRQLEHGYASPPQGREIGRDPSEIGMPPSSPLFIIGSVLCLNFGSRPKAALLQGPDKLPGGLWVRRMGTRGRGRRKGEQLIDKGAG